MSSPEKPARLFDVADDVAKEVVAARGLVAWLVLALLVPACLDGRTHLGAPVSKGDAAASSDGAASSDATTAPSDAAAPGDSAAVSCVDPPEMEAGTTAAGEICFMATACAHARGEVAYCSASTRQDVAAKIERCHILQPAARGAPCVTSRAPDGFLQVPTDLTAYSTTVPAVAGVCDGRDGLVCDGISRTCVPFAPLGGSCASTACAPPAMCGRDEICGAPLPIGAFCDAGLDFDHWPTCVPDAYCDLMSGVCVARLAEGGSCYADFACASGACGNNGLCAPARPPVCAS